MMLVVRAALFAAHGLRFLPFSPLPVYCAVLGRSCCRAKCFNSKGLTSPRSSLNNEAVHAGGCTPSAGALTIAIIRLQLLYRYIVLWVSPEGKTRLKHTITEIRAGRIFKPHSLSRIRAFNRDSYPSVYWLDQ